MNDNLLSIDVEAEIRKLCREQFPNDTERWLAWARVLIVAGTKRLHFVVSPRKFRLEAWGVELPVELFQSLSS